MGTKRLEATLAALIPAVLGYREDLPYISPEKIARDSVSFMQTGGPEMTMAVRLGILLLNVISLLTRGKLLKNLDREKQMRFLERCSRSRFVLIRGIALLIRLPIGVQYYNQDDVCLALGYNRRELCEDAEKHQVTR